jgi:hypothetical protein
MQLNILYLHMILLVLASPMTTIAPRLCNFLLLHAGWTSCILITTVYEKYLESLIGINNHIQKVIEDVWSVDRKRVPKFC